MKIGKMWQLRQLDSYIKHTKIVLHITSFILFLLNLVYTNIICQGSYFFNSGDGKYFLSQVWSAQNIETNKFFEVHQ